MIRNISVRLSEAEALPYWNLGFQNFGIKIIRSYFPLSVSIFCFLKKKAKGFPLLSGLGELFPEEIFRFP
jgi:hypothetical protein